MSESRLQKKIKESLEKTYEGSFWYVVHGGPYQRRGIPDIVGCLNGIFIAIEVKLPGKEHTLTGIQKHTIAQINESGGMAFMTTSVEETLYMLKTYLPYIGRN